MKHLFLILSFLFFLSNTIFAMANYERGYIITLKGDTINGFLFYQKSQNAAKQCVFKETLESDSKTYRPGEIASYRFIDGKFYISKQITTSPDPKQKVVFLEFLIKGISSIFYFIDKDGEYYYIEKEPYGLIELSEPIRISGNFILPTHYKGKLKMVMADCPDIVSEINDSKLNYSSLVELAKEYHNKVCKNESCIIYERKSIPIKLNFGILFGPSLSQYKFGNKFKSNYGTGYQMGISVNFKNVIFSNERVYFSVDLLLENENRFTLKPFDNAQEYTYLNYKGVDYKMLPHDNLVHDVTLALSTDFKLISLKLPLMVNYEYDLKKLSLKTGFGIVNKFVLSYNKELKMPDFEKQYGKTINTYFNGLIGKIGIEKKMSKGDALFANLTYEYLLPFNAANQFLRIMDKEFGLHLGYSF
jgi:hypothetical protein